MSEADVVRWAGYLALALCMVYVLVNAARASWFPKGHVAVTTPAATWEDAEYAVFTQHYDPGSAWNTPGAVPGTPYLPEARWVTVDRWPRVIAIDAVVFATQARPRGIFFNDPDVWIWCHNGFARYLAVARETVDNAPPAQGAAIDRFLCVRTDSLLLPVEDVSAVPHG